MIHFIAKYEPSQNFGEKEAKATKQLDSIESRVIMNRMIPRYPVA